METATHIVVASVQVIWWIATHLVALAIEDQEINGPPNMPLWAVILVWLAMAAILIRAAVSGADPRGLFYSIFILPACVWPLLRYIGEHLGFGKSNLPEAKFSAPLETTAATSSPTPLGKAESLHSVAHWLSVTWHWLLHAGEIAVLTVLVMLVAGYVLKVLLRFTLISPETFQKCTFEEAGQLAYQATILIGAMTILVSGFMMLSHWYLIGLIPLFLLMLCFGIAVPNDEDWLTWDTVFGEWLFGLSTKRSAQSAGSTAGTSYSSASNSGTSSHSYTYTPPPNFDTGATPPDWEEQVRAEEARMNQARQEAGYQSPPPPPPPPPPRPRLNPEIEKLKQTLAKIDAQINDRATMPGQRQAAQHIRQKIAAKLAALETAA